MRRNRNTALFSVQFVTPQSRFQSLKAPVIYAAMGTSVLASSAGNAMGTTCDSLSLAVSLSGEFAVSPVVLVARPLTPAFGPRSI